MNYIQNKLDEIENDLKEKGYTKFERETVIDITKQSLTDYHNHIVEKSKEIFGDISDNETEDALDEFVKYLQDTNQKE